MHGKLWRWASEHRADTTTGPKCRPRAMGRAEVILTQVVFTIAHAINFVRAGRGRPFLVHAQTCSSESAGPSFEKYERKHPYCVDVST